MVVAPGRDNSAAEPVRALHVDLFDRLTAARGATSDLQRARLLGINRNTIRRLRERQHTPSMPVATRLADRLDVTLDELFPVTERAAS